MAETFSPETPEQLADAIRWAVAEERPVDVLAGGSKRNFGRASQPDTSLDLSALSGVVLYEPEELVLTARAATPLADIEAVLAESKQQLAFEPGDLSPLLAADSQNGRKGGTLGGAIACNLAGPRRIKAGSARDHVLGFHAVSGRGEVFKSGGRVVKNVTGFDLSKLIAGSFGTLAVISELTVRALPAPDTTATILVLGCDGEAAVKAMTAALQTPYEVSGAAHLPAAAAVRSKVNQVIHANGAVTAVRVEGPEPSVAFRADVLRDVLAPWGAIDILRTDESLSLWREIRDVASLLALENRQVWRLSVPPAAGGQVGDQLGHIVDAETLFDWGGGLIWASIPAADDAGAATVRDEIAAYGGHATLVRAEPDVRAGVSVFQPQPEALAALTRRVKAGFDPKGVLNPGRMYAGV